jgi:hypothetical protein
MASYLGVLAKINPRKDRT